MAEMVRLGIVGCGAVTERHHLPALKRARDISVVALADKDVTRLGRLGQEYQIPRRYTTYRELIEAGNVDAVAVCVPPQLHAEVALAALEHGKHVFVEKPVALNIADCDRLIEASKSNPSRKVMVGFNLRWHRLVRHARDIIGRDELGTIRLVRTIFTSRKQDDTSGSAWRNSADTGGGVIFDLGVHHFDLVRFLLKSEVDHVHASSAGSEKTATVMFSMTNGAQVICGFGEGIGENQAFEIYGERGWLRVSCYRSDGLELFRVNDQPGAMTTRLRGTANTLLSLPRTLYRAWGGGELAASYVEEWNHFAQAVLLNRPVDADLLAGRRALEIALAASKPK
jgi:predicted dehydrogenase